MIYTCEIQYQGQGQRTDNVVQRDLLLKQWKNVVAWKSPIIAHAQYTTIGDLSTI